MRKEKSIFNSDHHFHICNVPEVTAFEIKINLKLLVYKDLTVRFLKNLSLV